MARIFWKDRESKMLIWGEFMKIGAGLTLRNGGPVQGFPKLDKDRNELVQMERIGSVLLVGVRDVDNGKLLSGWVAIDVGVDEMPHGNHSDYNYRNPPRVIANIGCTESSRGTINQPMKKPSHL